MNSKQLRKTIRAQRRQLSAHSLTSHSYLMARHATKCKPLQTSERIAFYFASDGEMDPAPLVARAIMAGKKCYFPVLRERPANALWFAEHIPTQPLKLNRFGIPEPVMQHHRITPPWGLDLIVLPLVAFDLTGNRLGMGGGYYDRTFSFKLKRNHWKGPKLIGLAHELQRIESLPTNDWDIPLNAVITERDYYQFA
jgi:5-formyltetrahydrofolate cyclo-ligase